MKTFYIYALICPFTNQIRYIGKTCNVKAVDACIKHGIKHNIATKEETSEDSLVPIGRSLASFGFYGTFGC